VTNPAFVRWTGIALAFGGLLTLLINLIFTPMLPPQAHLADIAASPLFLWRQSASALSVMLLLFGVVGLYLRQAAKAGRFGAIAFILAFVGTALALSVEWNEVFLVRDLAFRAPDALRILDAGHGKSIYDIGAITSISLFGAGWLLLAISTIRVGMSRPAAFLVIAGLILNPILAAVFSPIWGSIIADVVLASGWMWLGLDLYRTAGLAAREERILRAG
jgi:hypothetical protein